MTARNTAAARWLVFYYSVPSKPVKNRMSVWRRLVKAGALQLKDTVYILPFSNEHEEFLQWLTEDIASMGGEGAFLRTDRIEPVGNKAIAALFIEARSKDYDSMEKDFSVLERKLDAIRKGGGKSEIKQLSARHATLSNTLSEMLKTDFFNAPRGKHLKEQSERLARKLALVAGDTGSQLMASIKKRRIEDYRGRTWATRRNPFVDRMASAWFIGKFIDQKARFDFIDESAAVKPEMVLFDIKGGEFTHMGDLCTFEVLVKCFSIRDKAVIRISEIVHELDVKDGKYPHQEAKGIEDILRGIRKSASDDSDALTKGINVFEMLYQSLQ